MNYVIGEDAKILPVQRTEFKGELMYQLRGRYKGTTQLLCRTLEMSHSDALHPPVQRNGNLIFYWVQMKYAYLVLEARMIAASDVLCTFSARFKLLLPLLVALQNVG